MCDGTKAATTVRTFFGSSVVTHVMAAKHEAVVRLLLEHEERLNGLVLLLNGHLGQPLVENTSCSTGIIPTDLNIAKSPISF